MAQSLLTQHGVEYGSTMRTVAAKKHLAKKWRSRKQSCSESSSSTSESCSSSDSDGECSSSRSSTTAEREFSIVKESNFANGPLKLKIAARRIKKAQDVANGNFDPEDGSMESPLNGSEPGKLDIVGKNASGILKCSGKKCEASDRRRCKRKSSQKRCLQTKDSRVTCNGPYSSCKAPRNARRCSTSASSSSSSSSGSSSGSSGSSSSGSTSGSSTGCSSNSSSGSSSSGSSSSTNSSSSSSSSSGSSTGSESETCCSVSNYRYCRRKKNKVCRKASTKCQATCTLPYKPSCDGTISSKTSCTNEHNKRSSDKQEFGKGKCVTIDCARNKNMQISDIDCCTNSSSEEDGSIVDAKDESVQECFSMWRKVEEKHCAIVEDNFKNQSSSELMQVLSVTNAEVECNITSKIELLKSSDKQLNVNSASFKNQNSTSYGFGYCMEQMPSILKETSVAATSLDLDALPVALSHVSPDSGIQSSGDSPLRIECEGSESNRNTNQMPVSPVNNEFYQTSKQTENHLEKLESEAPKHVSPTPSPPVLTPSEPLWSQRHEEPVPNVEKRKCFVDDDPAPLLIQESLESKCSSPKPDEDSAFELKSAKTSVGEEIQSASKKTIDSEETTKPNNVPLSPVISGLSCDIKVTNSDTFSQSSLHLMFSEQSVGEEKTECSVFSIHTSSQLLPSASTSEYKRKRCKTSKRSNDVNTKADNELQLLVQSVQDSISSQFQGVESDELSDVDVNSIPVTALTCDATGDSFCDKLSSDDNIDMFLNTRACMSSDEKNNKSTEIKGDPTCDVSSNMNSDHPDSDTTSVCEKMLVDCSEKVISPTIQKENELASTEAEVKHEEIAVSHEEISDEVQHETKPISPDVCSQSISSTIGASENSEKLCEGSNNDQVLVASLSNSAPQTKQEDNSVLCLTENISESTDACIINDSDKKSNQTSKAGRKKSLKKGKRKGKSTNCKPVPLEKKWEEPVSQNEIVDACKDKSLEPIGVPTEVEAKIVPHSVNSDSSLHEDVEYCLKNLTIESIPSDAKESPMPIQTDVTTALNEAKVDSSIAQESETSPKQSLELLTESPSTASSSMIQEIKQSKKCAKSTVKSLKGKKSSNVSKKSKGNTRGRKKINVDFESECAKNLVSDIKNQTNMKNMLSDGFECNTTEHRIDEKNIENSSSSNIECKLSLDVDEKNEMMQELTKPTETTGEPDSSLFSLLRISSETNVESTSNNSNLIKNQISHHKCRGKSSKTKRSKINLNKNVKNGQYLSENVENIDENLIKEDNKEKEIENLQPVESNSVHNESTIKILPKIDDSKNKLMKGKADEDQLNDEAKQELKKGIIPQEETKGKYTEEEMKQSIEDLSKSSLPINISDNLKNDNFSKDVSVKTSLRKDIRNKRKKEIEAKACSYDNVDAIIAEVANVGIHDDAETKEFYSNEQVKDNVKEISVSPDKFSSPEISGTCGTKGKTKKACNKINSSKTDKESSQSLSAHLLDVLVDSKQSCAKTKQIATNTRPKKVSKYVGKKDTPVEDNSLVPLSELDDKKVELKSRNVLDTSVDVIVSPDIDCTDAKVQTTSKSSSKRRTSKAVKKDTAPQNVSNKTLVNKTSKVDALLTKSSLQDDEPCDDNINANAKLNDKMPKKGKTTKSTKKDAKSKVEEEKENFDIQKGEEEIEKGIHHTSSTIDFSEINETDLLEKESEKDDALSSLSVNEEECHVPDNYSDACGSSGIDRHSSLEMKHLKKKRAVKAKYSEDPTFIADLDDLATSLMNCFISKKTNKTRIEINVVPLMFQVKKYIKKNEKRSRLAHSAPTKNKVTKAKVLPPKKKSKSGFKNKVVKSAPKTLITQKTKAVNESCLPLKKRRCHVAPVQNQNVKPVLEPVVTKTPASKKQFSLKNSFDETIEDCIRKHMMSDTVESEKNIEHAMEVRMKNKKAKCDKKLASSESIEETIDCCIKQFSPTPEETVSEELFSDKQEDFADDIPLASLTKMKNQILPQTNKKRQAQQQLKPKVSDVSLAYRQKRKRLLKEACVQVQKNKEESESAVNGQKKKRRFRNKTGFVRIRKKKARPVVQQVVDVQTKDVNADGEVIDLTLDDTVGDAIETVIKSSEKESCTSRRKRKNIAQKCEIEVLDLTSGNDENDEDCTILKKPKMDDEEVLDPKYQQVIQVTEPSSGRKSTPIDPRKNRKREINFPKKKFLRAGLYSSSFKQDNHTVKKSNGKKSKSREIKEYIPEDHEFGLMPLPINYGKHFMEKRFVYKLPYEIWWLYKNKQLVYNDELTTNYRKIRTNVYVDIKPPTDFKNDDPSCNCTPPKDNRRKGCGADCLNRMMYVECSPQLCPCGDQCSNQRIFKHEWSPGLERFMTKDRGWGIRTTEYIRNGEFILEYVGEVVSDTEFRHRMAERYQNDQHHYCLSLDSGTVIDGYRLAGEGRFVNHSCEPNCEMQKWFVNGHYRVALFSLKDIYPNTELCYDYNFINYNLETQQICRCGSSKCRGFIGGRSQKKERLNGQNKEKTKQVKHKAVVDLKKGPGRPKKRKDDRPVEIQKEHVKNEYLPYNRQSFTIQMKPMSHQQRCYVQKHHCFLLRNYEKVKKAKDQARVAAEKEAEREMSVNKQDAFLTQFTALNTSRSVKTRRLAIAEENTELTKTARLAQVFKDIFKAVTSSKGEDGNVLATPFFQLPTKRRNSDYYNKIKFPIDFSMIEKNIITGHYASVEAFEDDFLRLFENAEEFYGRTSEFGLKISHLRKSYEAAKTDAMILFEDILGEAISSVFLSSKTDDKSDEDDEVIRCICNIYKDEGLMIQCEKCLVWQHCDCVGVDGKVEKYLCEQCSGLELSKEVLMIPRPHYATPDCQYYITLLKDELQIKQGDCVYLRYEEEEGSSSCEKVQDQILAQGMENGDAAARESLRGEKTEQLDIFRVERLWKDEENKKYAFGHHYLRPHETYHEPSRKFFPNEVFRVPLYEIISFDSIIGHCCVLDLPTYCKGRPKGYKEEDIYICEYRVDKTAHMFYKISKIKYPVCTKKYAFDHFDKKLNPKRTFVPHTVPSAYQKKVASDRGSCAERKSSKSDLNQKDEKKKKSPVKEIDTRLEETPESREKKRTHLNKFLLKLLSQMPCKQTVDLSYLLDGSLGKRIRRKTNLSLS
ncbi:serine-rich adhesin for platelets-like [Uloborus diversus]|uniref:serine-rich adhesin for platelets-like n=1 Tax=Uloborus diversus TaxID=327109 RepID=UPI0024093A08|nr:serine-rich adhesin for platelets-like [Uloborus diversus]